MGFQLDDLHAFSKVAQLRSFSAAAATLGITSSGLSKTIGRLESELGVQLLNRNTRSVAVTPEGELFLADTLRLLALSDEIQNEIKLRQTKPSGLLKVNVSTTMGRLMLIPRLPELFELQPGLRLDLRFTDQPEDLILTGRDVGIWFGELPDRYVKHRVLARTSRITAASPIYLKQFGTPKSIEDLATHRCLATTGWGTRMNWRFKDQSTFDKLHLNPFLQVNSVEALRACVLHGLGIAQGSSLLLNRELISKGQLVQLFPQEVTPGENISAIYPHGKQGNPLTHVFIQFVTNIMETRAHGIRTSRSD